MRLLHTLIIVFTLSMAVLWGTSFFRPLLVSVARTPQEVWFLDAADGRLRLTHQRVSPAVLTGLAAEAGTLHTITLRDAAGTVVASERDPFHRDAKNPWWFDENGGNMIMSRSPLAGASANMTMHFVCVPIWAAVGPAALFPLLARARSGWIRRRRCRQGLCIGCGYDLRGTPQQCPECGAPHPPDAAAAA